MRRMLLLTALCVLGAVTVALPVSAQEGPVVAVDQESVDTVIGTETVMTVEISNSGTAPTGPLVAHLLVVDPAGGGSADAEDWTSELNRPLDSLAPDEAHTIEWDVAPIMAGDYRVLISVVPIDGGPPSVSPQIRFTVSQPDALVSGATLPVAIAVPVIAIGAALVTRRIERTVAHRPT